MVNEGDRNEGVMSMNHIFIENQAFCLSMLSRNGKLEHLYYVNKEAAEEAEEALKGEKHG